MLENDAISLAFFIGIINYMQISMQGLPLKENRKLGNALIGVKSVQLVVHWLVKNCRGERDWFNILKKYPTYDVGIRNV